MSKLRVVPAFLLACWPLLAGAEIYKWVDAQGQVHFANQKPAEQPVEIVALDPGNVYSAAEPGPESTPQPVAQRLPEVVMLSTQRCGVCKMAKSYMQSKNIPYTEYDVETSERGQEWFTALRGKGVPILLVGNERLDGFDASSLDALLKRAAAR